MAQYSEPVGESWKYDTNYHRMADFFSLNVYDRNDYHVAKRVEYLKSWANGGKDKPFEKTVTTLENLRRRLGKPVIGRSLVDELYHYVKLSGNSNSQYTPKNPKPREQKPKEDIQETIKKTVKTMVDKSIKKHLEEQKEEAPPQPVAPVQNFYEEYI